MYTLSSMENSLQMCNLFLTTSKFNFVVLLYENMGKMDHIINRLLAVILIFSNKIFRAINTIIVLTFLWLIQNSTLMT